MIAAPGKGGIHADDRVGNGGNIGPIKEAGEVQKPVRQQCRKRRHRNDSRAGRAKIRSNANAENTNTGRIEKQQKKAGKAKLPSPPACRRMRLYRRRAHLLAAQGGMTYIFPSIYEIGRNGNVFPEKFSRWEHEFFEYFA